MIGRNNFQPRYVQQLSNKDVFIHTKISEEKKKHLPDSIRDDGKSKACKCSPSNS